MISHDSHDITEEEMRIDAHAPYKNGNHCFLCFGKKNTQYCSRGIIVVVVVLLVGTIVEIHVSR